MHGLEFHHFGLAVPAPEEAFRYLRALGYCDGAAVFDPAQRVNLAMRHHATMPDVEVIWPGNEPSPIDRMIRRTGPMVYHICYSCRCLATSLAVLEEAGLAVMEVSPPTPAPLFDGRAVSFHLISGVGLIEFLEVAAG